MARRSFLRYGQRQDQREVSVFVIVYGALRSGTTLLRLMLDKHPELSCPGEADFLFDYLTFDKNGNISIDVDALKEGRIYQNSAARVNPDLPARDAVLDMIHQMRTSEDQCVVLMLHRGITSALRLFRDVPVLHILRDPRDVARSSIGMGWVGTVYHGTEHWMETEDEWDAMEQAYPDAKTQTLTYENLIKATEHELKRIAAFFGVSYDPDMLTYHAGSTYGPPDVSLIEQWRRKQSPHDVALIEGRLKKRLAARGYEPSGYAPITPSPLFKLSLWGRNKTLTWRERIKRYGMIDPVIVSVSRRVKVPALSQNARKRMNRKRLRYLK
jgi:hypothetical protein